MIRDPERPNMFKRPIPRVRFAPAVQFVSTSLPGGGIQTQWVPVGTPRSRIPSGTPGIVGEIIDKMRAPVPAYVPPTTWTPPQDYEFVAQYNSPEWLETCRAWDEAHPRPPPPARIVPPVINRELIAELFRRRTTVPSIEERVATYRAAGFTEQCIARIVSKHQRFAETHGDIDAMFARWPSASKPTPKPRAKVVKAVKKKL